MLPMQLPTSLNCSGCPATRVLLTWCQQLHVSGRAHPAWQSCPRRGVNAVPPVLPETDPGEPWAQASLLWGSAETLACSVSIQVRLWLSAFQKQLSQYTSLCGEAGKAHLQQSWISRPSMWTLPASSKELWPLDPPRHTVPWV